MSFLASHGQVNTTVIRLAGGRAVGVSAGDQIRIMPHGSFKGDLRVLSATTSADDIRRFLLSALPDCTVIVKDYGEFQRKDIQSVSKYEG